MENKREIRRGDMCENKKYIHYGHKKFDRERFTPINNERCFVKPIGGLWASPVDAEWGWKQWCKSEKFRDCNEDNSFTFTLSEKAVVVHIRSIKNLSGLPRVENEFTLNTWYCIDFERLLEIGIDAVELHLSEEDRRGLGVCEGLNWSLYGWDCDSILIMNPDVVVEV